jgi:hypothetical protein
VIQEDMAVVALLLLPPLRESGQLELLAGIGDDGLSGPDEPVGANRRPGGMDGCRKDLVERSGVERDEVASIMDGCCVEYCIAARIL